MKVIESALQANPQEKILRPETGPRPEAGPLGLTDRRFQNEGLTS